MKFIHIRNRAYDRYVREDNEVCLEQRMVRINGRFCWRWCVYADCGGNVVEILWDSFSDDEKPEWTSLEEIERFSKKMLEEEIY